MRILLKLALSLLTIMPLFAGTARAEQYHFDKLHTQILFFVDHLGFSKSHGEFLKFDGGFDFNPRHISNSSVQIVIHTDGLNMNDERWDKRMKSADYFDVEKYPTMTFRSTSVTPTGDKTFDIHGNLTMLGATHPLVVHTRFNKAGANLKSGNHIAGFSAEASLQRSQWGMKHGIPFIGDEVGIRIEVEGIFER